MNPDALLVFPGPLGWMGLIAAGTTVQRLTFGHATAAAARAALKDGLQGAGVVSQTLGTATPRHLSSPLRTLVHRLQAYAAGTPDDFRDVRIDLGPSSPFRRAILNQCRCIPYGSTLSYAKLAIRAGYPGAARAVGNCMAANPIPLIVPCHRVVCSNGRLGAYSAPGEMATKCRLLTLESPKLT